MLKRFTNLFFLIPALAVTGILQSVHADWSVTNGGISAADPQDVVISLKSDPNQDPEAACLAVTFARSLSGNPKANITLFVTLDGVNLASDKYISKRRLKKYECTTPFDPQHVTLEENLIAFLEDNPGGDDSLVVCPICWKERYGDKIPDYGVLPGVEGVPGNAIGLMMFNADKILDF
ncbi:MAG: hypothetical protein WBM59_12065 [Sedimenticolaceae bacterium]